MYFDMFYVLEKIKNVFKTMFKYVGNQGPPEQLRNDEHEEFQDRSG